MCPEWAKSLRSGAGLLRCSVEIQHFKLASMRGAGTARLTKTGGCQKWARNQLFRGFPGQVELA
jgi:hypothetical protein